MRTGKNKKIYGMIFAAGLGTRLTPFTLNHPKAMVPVGGVPMLERVIKQFLSAGIEDIVVNVHHFAVEIKNFLRDKRNFGVNILLSDETDELLDTGGGLLKAYDLLKDADNVLVHNADVLTDIDLKELLDAHIKGDFEVTLLTEKRQSSRVLYFDKQTKRLSGWENLKTQETKPSTFANKDKANYNMMAFGGVHVLSQSVLKKLKRNSSEKVFSIIPFYVNNCDNLKISYFKSKNKYLWFDVGSPEKLKTAEENVHKMKFLDPR